MDLMNVMVVGLFATGLEYLRVVFLDDIRLS